ncbi:hypothetical protein PT974_09134 [Cladobotryum mycophilum]|uniref:Uncharacterized protein n=1 Tax=Cladobotryum mycophilum TaxID=491253 RepID=A0ABR0SFV6_9HYPO
MSPTITSPNLSTLLAPILPALPSATISTEPAVGILPLLSPILRQRVQIFSATSTEPWLRLLCYDSTKAVKLAEIVRRGNLEPHPVSGEVEIDWDYDSQTRYRKVDQETLQAMTVLLELELAFQLVYCVGDAEGGGDGWRIGELTVADKSSPFSHFGGYASLAEAESQFQATQTSRAASVAKVNGQPANAPAEEQDEDDGYWDRYDATPARTPANHRSPAPQTTTGASKQPAPFQPHPTVDDDDDDDYYAQYDEVQPAMDNHDPEEEAQLSHIQPPLGLGRAGNALDSSITAESSDTRCEWTFAELEKASASSNQNDTLDNSSIGLLHPRPESSASSTGSHTVAKLEASAGKQEQNEFGVKQHVSRSLRSLYMLSRASGIDREEFERIVRAELDMLAMLED